MRSTRPGVGPLTGPEVAQIRSLRNEDGLTLYETARIVGCHWATVMRIAPGWPGKIDNEPLREAFLRSGKSAADVARAAGWVYERASCRLPVADTSRVKRTLGLIDDVSKGGHRARRSTVDAETAGVLAEAIGVAPWEVGA